jgi:hypothetical protein
MRFPLCVKFQFSISPNTCGNLLKIVMMQMLLVISLASARAQQWENPCKTTVASGANACSFLRHAFELEDSSCGISFASTFNLFHPSTWRHKQIDPYQVIPESVLQALPRSVFNQTEDAESQPTGTNFGAWQSTNLVTMSRLMTTVQRSEGSTPDPGWFKEINKPSQEAHALYFNPLTDPAIFVDDGYSSATRHMSCTLALTAGETGNLKAPTVGLTEKFKAQENSLTSSELVYGTFKSPLAYLKDANRFSYLLEEVDFYRKNPEAAAGTNKLFYLREVEGLLIYSSVKDNNSTNFDGNSDVGVAAGVGGISLSLNGSTTYLHDDKANLYRAILRNDSWESLDSLENIKSEVRDGNGIVSTTGEHAEKLVYDSKSGQVSGKFSIDWLPSNLCLNRALVYSVEKGGSEVADSQVSAKRYVSTKSGSTKTPSGCEFDVSLPGDLDSAVKVTVKIPIGSPDKPANTVDIATTLPYTLKKPNVEMVSEPVLTAYTADFWYRIQQPELVDMKQTVDLESSELTCNGKVIKDTHSTIAFASAYLSPAGRVNVSGMLLHLQYQLPKRLSRYDDETTRCYPSVQAKLSASSGAPIVITLPQATGKDGKPVVLSPRVKPIPPPVVANPTEDKPHAK